jgi:hypothetical protein
VSTFTVIPVSVSNSALLAVMALPMALLSARNETVWPLYFIQSKSAARAAEVTANTPTKACQRRSLGIVFISHSPT